MAKFYRDEQGNLYSVDRETGAKTLVRPAEPSGDEVVSPNTPDDTEIVEDV